LPRKRVARLWGSCFRCGSLASPSRGANNMTAAAAGRVDKGLAASYVSKCFCFPGIFSTLSAGLMGNLAGERPAIRGS
jgi:hypothetical protein